MDNRAWAFWLILIAGIMNSAFALPMKGMRRWSWQSTWLSWSLFALVIFPAWAAAATVPHLFLLYSETPPWDLARLALFGAGWGVAQVLFGLALEAAGLAITFALVLGTSACFGSLLPLVMFPGRIVPDLSLLLMGIAVMAVGLTISAYAGSRRKAKQLTFTESHSPPMRGIGLALLSGVCASCMNIGLASATPMLRTAITAGAQPYFATNFIWFPLLAGGAVPNVIYCIFLSWRQKTSNELRLRSTGGYYLITALMGALWFGSSIAYGAATHFLGKAGPVQGWPLYMSMIVICAGLLGFGTGEWRGTNLGIKSWQISGMAMLVFGIYLLAGAQR